MVSEVVEAPQEVDQVPDEPQTEGILQEEEVAAEAVEEAAAEEPEQLEPTFTAAELAQRERQAALSALEYDRRMRQSVEGQRAAEQARRQQEQAAMAETVEAALIRSGITPDDEIVKTVVERVNGKRAEFSLDRASSDLESAVQYATAPLRNEPGNAESLSPAAVAFTQKIVPELQRAYEAGMKAAAGEMIPKSELPKLVDAEIQKRNAKAREGKTNLRHVDGTPTTNTNTLEYWEHRVAHEGEDGVPDMTGADWAAYKSLRRQHGYS